MAAGDSDPTIGYYVALGADVLRSGLRPRELSRPEVNAEESARRGNASLLSTVNVDFSERAAADAAGLTDSVQQIDRRLTTKRGLPAHRKIASLLLGFTPACFVQITVKTEIFSSEALG
jgi:hypothetical protein